MNRPTSKRSLLFLGMIIFTAIFLLGLHSAFATPVLVENFSNNSFNHSVWQTEIVGSGPSVAVVNSQFVVTLSSNSTNDPSFGVFGGALLSLCPLQGDFDMQVGFQLLTWPHDSGARTGLGSILQLVGPGSASSSQYAVERNSFNTPREFFPHNETYVTQFQDGVQGYTFANNTSGMLRVTRSGGTASGYYFKAGSWTLIHSGPITTGEVGLSFGAWSQSNVFAQQPVQVAFNNFTLNTGQLVCPAISVNPTSGGIGTKVVVTGTNFPAPLSGGQTVEVTFDDLFLGTTANDQGAFSFTLDVPTAQPGAHLIKALDLSTGANATTTFQVTLERMTLGVSLTVGTVYFPGDTVVASVLVTASGVPLATSNLSLNLTLTRPDGSSIPLIVTPTGTGLYRASYILPKTAQIGTYSMIVTAASSSLGNGSATAAFEVKLPWLSSQGQTAAIAGIGSVTAIGIGLVSWRKGYFRRKD